MTHKLLLADDSITIQRVVELTFADQGVEVLAVGDGEQAIARIPVDQPDIVLADIGMPKRNGYDVAAFVKSHPDLRHIPVLLLAGAFEPVDEKRAEQVGCNGVLVKPFEPQHVISRVRELLGGAVGTPGQAAPDVGRPVERLLEFPRRDEPEAADPLADFPLANDFASEPEFPHAPDLEGAPAAPDLEATASIPQFNDGESLDDYFARLGAALEAPPSPPPAPTPDPFADLAPAPVEEPPAEVPTLDQLLAAPAPAIDLPVPEEVAADPTPSFIEPPPIEPPDTSATLAPQPADLTPAEDVAPRNVVADAFSALLAVEEGDPTAAPVRLPSGLDAPAAPVITDALVDAVARRVIERLSRDTARDLVADAVSDIAERLVREEIARIRNK